jgi:gliding motility-associated-like protein
VKFGYHNVQYHVCAKEKERVNGRRILSWHYDSICAVFISFNCDTFSDVGFSLKLNQPLIKDSLYELNFMVRTFGIYRQIQYFNEKNTNRIFNDFRIKVTQSENPNQEGEQVAVITRNDVYEKDTSHWFTSYGYESYRYSGDTALYNQYMNHERYCYRVRIKVKGKNEGQFLTFKGKLYITDTLSKLYYHGFKPQVLSFNNWGEFAFTGLYCADFELKSPFQLEKTGDLCGANSPMTLKSNNHFEGDRYQWSTGDSSETICINKPGLYWLTKERNGSYWTDSIFIQGVETKVNQIQTMVKCRDSSISIGANKTHGQSDFNWNTFNQTPVIEVKEPGTYIRNFNLLACPMVDTFHVKNYPRHKAVENHVYTICFNDSIHIKSSVNSNEWFKANVLYSDSKDINLKAKDTNETLLLKSYLYCCQYDTIYIVVDTCFSDIKSLVYFPNSFTPNGDGINDVFEVVSEQLEQIELNVYNRWGELVFHSVDKQVEWDGNCNGSPSPEGVYLVQMKLIGKTQPNGTHPIAYVSNEIYLYR